MCTISLIVQGELAHSGDNVYNKFDSTRGARSGPGQTAAKSK